MYGRLIFSEIIEIVRNELAFSVTGKIMIVNGGGFSGICYNITVEVTQFLFLFRIHAQNRLARIKVFLLQSGNIFKLSVAILMLSHGSLFLWLTLRRRNPSCEVVIVLRTHHCPVVKAWSIQTGGKFIRRLNVKASPSCCSGRSAVRFIP